MKKTNPWSITKFSIPLDSGWVSLESVMHEPYCGDRCCFKSREVATPTVVLQLGFNATQYQKNHQSSQRRWNITPFSPKKWLVIQLFFPNFWTPDVGHVCLQVAEPTTFLAEPRAAVPSSPARATGARGVAGTAELEARAHVRQRNWGTLGSSWLVKKLGQRCGNQPHFAHDVGKMSSFWVGGLITGGGDPCWMTGGLEPTSRWPELVCQFAKSQATGLTTVKYIEWFWMSIVEWLRVITVLRNHIDDAFLRYTNHSSMISAVCSSEDWSIIQSNWVAEELL